MNKIAFALALGGLLLVPRAMPAGETALGDAGHSLRFVSALHVLNPEGQPFEVWFQRMLFPQPQMYGNPLRVTVTAPDGDVLLTEDLPPTVENAPVPVTVPAAGRGVYRIGVDGGGSYWHCRVSLPRAVVEVAEPGAAADDHARPVFTPMVPRRWWFWVPADALRFTVRAKRLGFMSQREDYGLTVCSPRGQRMAVLWGQPNPGAPAIEERTILVEPGSAGRFWSLEIRLGDSHTFSDVNVSLEGVPPYLAPSPEAWFDPGTGKPAPVVVYDDAQFMQFARNEAARNRNVVNWSPCPSLGDPDGCEIPAPARFALWNPDGRELLFKIGTYITRPQPDTARVTFSRADGATLFEKRVMLATLHDVKTGWPDERLLTGREPVFVRVEDAEHFIAFTYPATPLVLIASEVDGWNRFGVEVGTARNWYFFVSPGTRTFAVRMDTGAAADVADLEINAPDRTMAKLYGTTGETLVHVPPDQSGKIWHFRLDVGAATRFETVGPRPRHTTIRLTLDLRGVPGYLSPTWEQWFDPASPVPPHAR
jgi:hypothetical protein